jgi:hypothetical protein
VMIIVGTAVGTGVGVDVFHISGPNTQLSISLGVRVVG